MLLSKNTVKNIQKAIEASSFTVKDIKVKAIFSNSKISLALYNLDGEMVVSQLYPAVGSKMSDLILDAAAFSDYYLLDQVYSGLEKDDIAELILELWPSQEKRNVVQISSSKPEPVSQASLNKLANNFNRHNSRYRK